MTYAAFILQFPEFSKLTQAQVEVFIAQATLAVSSEAYGDLYETAIAYTAAHQLALAPFSQQMRMVQKDGETSYSMYLKEWIRPKIGRRAMVL